MKEFSRLFKRFFEHLETCGGCTGTRSQERCNYALLCYHVERMAREGVAFDSEDFSYLDNSDNLIPIVRRSCASRASLYGIGPCNID